MSDQQNAEATETDATADEQAEQKPTETVEFWKQKAREQEKRAKANADAATKLAELEESQKTETQRLTDQLAAEKSQRESLEKQALRLQVAAEKGIPAELIDRLRGDTEDELSADADALLELVGERKKKSSLHVPREGATTSAEPDDLREFTRGLFGKSD